MHCKVRRVHLGARAKDAFEVSGAHEAADHGATRPLLSLIRCRCRESGGFSSRSDGQALAALGAAGVDHGPSAPTLHANQEAVGAGAADFRSLIRAFHDLSNEIGLENVPHVLKAWGNPLLHQKHRYQSMTYTVASDGAGSLTSAKDLWITVVPDRPSPTIRRLLEELLHNEC